MLNLLSGVNKAVPVDGRGRLKADNSWKAALALLKEPKKFLQDLLGFKGEVDAGNVKLWNFDANREQIADPEFTPDRLKKASPCASGVCAWIINITKYYDVVTEVEPKKQAVREANEQLAVANEKKRVMEELVAELNAKLAILQASFDKAMKEKADAEESAARSARRLDLANRLINALGANVELWGAAIVDIGKQIEVVVGDVLLASAFVSYVGPFNKKYRDMILNDKFCNYFTDRGIPVSPEKNPLAILTNDAEIASWNNEKLPSDRVSTENGTILTNSDRFSLIIDPQLQGITWLKDRFKNVNLQVTRLSNKKMVSTIE